MDQNVLAFIDKVISGSAEAATIHREHIADQGGELLPHVLMGDIARLAVTTTARDECPEWLIRLLQQLEWGLLSGSSEVAELVGVSFVENLCGEAKAIAVLLPRMGDALRREVRTICGV